MANRSKKCAIRTLMRSAGFFVLLTLGWPGAVEAFSPAPKITKLELSQIQLGTREGGRANTIAVHPTNDKLILVASESGGLFRTLDGGQNWNRIDEVPFMLASVVFLPTNPDVALLTALEDFKADPGGGGVWRSDNQGKTWKQTPTPPGVERGRLSAYEISIAPDTGIIYVGHASGILVSQNDQGQTWKHISVFTGDEFSGTKRSVYSVLALGGKTILAAGPGGMRRSFDGGLKWSSNISAENNEPLSSLDLHAFGGPQSSKGSFKNAYFASGSGSLYFTVNGGQKWAKINPPPSGGGEAFPPGKEPLCGTHNLCGGTRFVKVVVPTTLPLMSTRTIDLYFGDRCCVSRLRCPQKISGNGFDYSGKWKKPPLEHLDTRDLAFDKLRRPLLLATDGGLQKFSTSDSSWKLTGSKEGFNALQITEVRGQYIQEIAPGVGRYDLYFGTQDNGFWSSDDGGITWSKGGGGEGAFIQAERIVAKVVDSKITYEDTGLKTNFISGSLFSKPVLWSNAPFKTFRSAPVILEAGRYVQAIVMPPKGPPSVFPPQGLAITSDTGKNWQDFVEFNVADVYDVAKVATAGNSSSPTMLYQGIKVKKRVQLARIVQEPKMPAQVFYPAMSNFGSLGMNPTGAVGLSSTGIAKYHVYAIDPADPLHLIAADAGAKVVIFGQTIDRPPGMMESHDGGENWKAMPELTNLVTDDGSLLFVRPADPKQPGLSLETIVGTIGFSPQDPDLVLVGTFQSGLYLSQNNGQAWQKVEGSDVVTNASSIHWMSANEVVISTYGRGLWRLKIEIQDVPPPKPELLCDRCLFSPFDILNPNPIDHAVIENGVFVFEGEIVGAIAESGTLREVFVTPGSSVIFVSKDGRPAGVRVTRTNQRMGYRGVRQAPPPPKRDWITRGLVFDEDKRLKAGAFAAGPARKFTPKPVRDVGGSLISPTAGQPFVRVVTSRFAGVSAATPDEQIQFGGGGFAPGSSLEVLIDEQPTSRKIRVNDAGVFVIQVSTPQEFGLHSIGVRDVATREVLDSSIFLVTHRDQEARRAPVKRRRLRKRTD